VTTFLKTIRKPFGIILPLDEVKRRVICDALDKCGGNYLPAARLLGWEHYSLSHGEGVQLSGLKGASERVNDRSARSSLQRRQPRSA
jgi:hypothetical protein